MTMGVLNLIPYLGSMIGLMITVPLAYFQSGGGLGLVALVLLTITISQLIEAYVLTPRIMATVPGCRRWPSIFALFFWGTALGGVFGMILAIPLTAFLVVCWRLLKAKYIKGVV
jgi:predicted PurR-regulated permease PerM